MVKLFEGAPFQFDLPDIGGLASGLQERVGQIIGRPSPFGAPQFQRGDVGPPQFQQQQMSPPQFAQTQLQNPSFSGAPFAVAGLTAPSFGTRALGAPMFNPTPLAWPQPKPPPEAPGGSGGAPGSPSSGMEPAVAQWGSKAQQYFGQYADVMLAIMTNESHGNPAAQNPGYPAHGLFQQVGLTTNDPDEQFAAAKKLLDEKLKGIADAYAANGLNPDERTRARDIALAWAGHFNYKTGLPNTSSKDIVSGQTADQLAKIFLTNYDAIRSGRSGGGNIGLVTRRGQQAIDFGKTLMGIDYTNGGIRNTGDPRTGMDCSSFTGYVLGLDKNMWNAQAQYDNTKRVSYGDLQPGDLVFYQGTSSGDPTARPVTHVGIYIGNGQMIHTGTPGRGVEIVNITTPYWQQHFYGGGRV